MASGFMEPHVPLEYREEDDVTEDDDKDDDVTTMLFQSSAGSKVEDNALRAEKERIENLRLRRQAFLSSVSNIADDAIEKVANVAQNRSAALAGVPEQLSEQVRAFAENSERNNTNIVPESAPLPPPPHRTTARTELTTIEPKTEIRSGTGSYVWKGDGSDLAAQKHRAEALFTNVPDNNNEISRSSESDNNQSDPIGQTTLRAPNRSTAFAKIKQQEAVAIGGDVFIGDAPTRSVTESEAEAGWRAKQDDLVKIRRDFHGAVTQEFEGVFSWQMYGAAHAVDFNGNYTEYIMRCQWGPSWDSIQPWMVTRRFREFESLDTALRTDYPQVAHLLQPLPPKLYLTIPGVLNALTGEPDDKIVAKRKMALEHYISTIVTAIPVALQSKVFQEFLSIPERVRFIRKSLAKERKREVRRAVQAADALTAGQPLRKESAALAGYDCENPLFLEELLTSDGAEAIRLQRELAPLSEREMEELQAQIKSLKLLLRALPPSVLLSNTEVRQTTRYCMVKWPALRATAQLETYRPTGSWSGSTAIALVAGALKAEEDLLAATEVVRSAIVAAERLPAHLRG